MGVFRSTSFSPSLDILLYVEFSIMIKLHRKKGATIYWDMGDLFVVVKYGRIFKKFFAHTGGSTERAQIIAECRIGKYAH